MQINDRLVDLWKKQGVWDELFKVTGNTYGKALTNLYNTHMTQDPEAFKLAKLDLEVMEETARLYKDFYSEVMKIEQPAQHMGFHQVGGQ